MGSSRDPGRRGAYRCFDALTQAQRLLPNYAEGPDDAGFSTARMRSGVLNATAATFTLEGTYDATSANPGYTYNATGTLAGVPTARCSPSPVTTGSSSPARRRPA